MLLNQTNKQIIKDNLINNQESCGLFVKIRDNIIAYPCKNYAEEPETFFIISPKDYLYYSKIGNIIGCFHTHEENNYLRAVDKLMANNLKLKYVLYCKKTDEFIEYTPDSYKNTYVGRKFEFNKNDCLTLVKDYYLNELNIKIGNYFLDDNWYYREQDLITKNIETENFIEQKEPKLHDIVCLRYRRGQNPSHLAIYLGDDTILHQPRVRLSTVENYSEELKNRTTHILRHKSLC